MATAQLGAVRRVFDRVRQRAADDRGDGELLDRFRAGRDDDAFGLLVRRHGPMVLGVCRRVLRDPHAAEDAFQATFLVLARKAGEVRPPGVLGAWLHGVAYRTALKARGREFRRRQVEHEYAQQQSLGTAVPRLSEPGTADLRRVIDQQLHELPEKYRLPLVLCAVQGLGKAEAADRLGLPEGTVSSRLARAREMLRDRLTRRGVAVPAAGLGAALTPGSLRASVPPDLCIAATEQCVGLAPIAPDVLTLTHEVVNAMTLTKWNLLSTLAVAVALSSGGLGVYVAQADEKKPVGEKPAAVKPAAEKPARPRPDGDKPKPAGEKPAAIKVGGEIVGVDPKARTLTLGAKGDKGTAGKVVKLAADAKVFIDGKPAGLAAVTKGSFASFGGLTAKDGRPVEAAEVRVTGPTATGLVTKADAGSITLDVGGKDGGLKAVTAKLTADTKVSLGTKEAATAADLKAGDKVTVVLTTDWTAALAVVGGGRDKGDGDKPGAKPVKKRKFVGQIGGVDAKGRTVTLIRMGEGGPREDVMKLTADAKVMIDGKEAKLDDLPKGGAAELVLAAARDGRPLEVSEVVVNTMKFTAVVKEATATSVTLLGGGPNSKAPDRVLKLAPGGKVLIDGKESKLTDLQAGDRANIVMTADKAVAKQISVSTVREGDKPNPDKPKAEKPAEKPKGGKPSGDKPKGGERE